MAAILKLRGFLLLAVSLFNTERFIFQTDSSFVANAQSSGGADLLKLSFSHENKTMYKSGDSFWYSFTLQHDSNDDAKNIVVTWYIPYYIQPDRLLTTNIDVTIERNDGRIAFKIPKLSKAVTGQFKFQVMFDVNKQLDTGHHYIVSTVQTVWKTESSQVLKNVMQSYSVEAVIPGCSKPLGMTDGRLKAHQLIASSAVPSSRPEMARYNKDAWCAQQIDKRQFITILFAKKTQVTKIVTWGRNRKQHWVTEYTVQFSLDNMEWIVYKENGIEKLFKANSNPESAVEHWLLYPFKANYLRINPRGWKTQICMRFELYGCDVSHEDNCVDPIGMADGRIPDESLSDSVDNQGDILPINGRLDKVVQAFPFGWSGNPDLPNNPDYLQVDLGSVHKVTRTAIQGSYNEPYPIFYVTSYKIAYSNNSINWYTASDKGNDKIFKGPEASDAAKFPTPAFFPSPIYARYFRIVPENFIGMKVLRAELYGCSSEQVPVNKVPVEFSRRSVLLSNKTNHFFVCFYQRSGPEASCQATTNGNQWADIHTDIVNIIGHDVDSNDVFGIDRYFSYRYSKDGGVNWKIITNEEWKRYKENHNVVLATKLKDILVGEIPRNNFTFYGTTGLAWGVSGKGVHLNADGSSWQLVATWKCCNF